MRYNYITDLPPNIFYSTPAVTNIYLNNNGLSDLPAGIFQNLTKLENLLLSNNKLTVLPIGIFDFTSSLVVLDVENNKLRILPNKVFHGLQLLHTLNLAGNMLNGIPNVFQFSTGLVNLNIARNNITTLQTDIFISLKQLKFLDCSFNKLTVYKVNMSSLINLEYVTLQGNLLRTLLPNLSLLTNLKVVDWSSNMLSVINSKAFVNLQRLVYLTLSHNNLSSLASSVFADLKHLKSLDLSFNSLETISPAILSNLTDLNYLKLSHNQLSRIEPETFSFLNNLKILEMQHNLLSLLSKNVFQVYQGLAVLNVSYNKIQTICADSCSNIGNVEIIDLRNNPLLSLNDNSFVGFNQASILVDTFGSCCFLGNKTKCISTEPRSVYLTCSRMFPSLLLRWSISTLGLTAMLTNAVVMWLQLFKYKGIKGQRLLLLHLSMSDFLMGVSMVILSVSDIYYSDSFPSYSETWRTGALCQIAGILSMLSSETSVFLVTLISLDRVISINFPLSTKKLGRTSSQLVLAIIWLFCLFVSIVPISISYEFPNIFDVSEVCVGIPLVKRPVVNLRTSSMKMETYFYLVQNANAIAVYDSSITSLFGDTRLINSTTSRNIKHIKTIISNYQLATLFSIVVFIGINTACFIIVFLSYIMIFHAVSKSRKRTNRAASEQEIKMALRMFSIVLTDFLCWIPISFACIFVQCGVITVPPELYAWVVAFILPINSSINPFLYTLASAVTDLNIKVRSSKFFVFRKTSANEGN